MAELHVPKALRDSKKTPYLIEGPFALSHDGHMSIGLWFEQRDGYFTVYNGAHGCRLDETFTPQVHGDMISFYSEHWKTKYVLRPLTQDDVAWLAPDEPEVLIEDLKEIILRDYRSEFDNNL